jgi:uracil-DNA glycosylase
MAIWRTPRPLGNPLNVSDRKKLKNLYANHVAPLNQLVDRIRTSDHGDDTVPYFDPAGAGINALVLILQQDPSRVAAEETGFISPDNPDETADNTTWLRNEAGLKSEELVHWNIIPWYVGKKDIKKEIDKAKPFLIETVSLLQELKVVVCMGNNARNGWDKAMPYNPSVPGWKSEAISSLSGLLVLSCPHPSWRNIRGANKNKNIRDGLNPEERILATFKLAGKVIDSNIF